MGNEVSSIPKTDKGFIRIDYGLRVTNSVSIDLEVIGGDAAAQMSVSAE